MNTVGFRTYRLYLLKLFIARKPTAKLKSVAENRSAGKPAGTEELPGVVQLPDGHGPHISMFSGSAVGKYSCSLFGTSTAEP